MRNGFRGMLVLVTLATLGLCVDSLAPVARAGDSAELTPAAKTAVMALYPEAGITGVEMEREDGLLYYEVVVRNGDEEIELEVAADGTIGEVETRIAWDDVPKNVQQTILGETGGAELQGIERREVRGVPRGESFVAVSSPITLYEVEYKSDDGWREIAVTSKGLVLTELDDDSDSSDDDSSSGDDDS